MLDVIGLFFREGKTRNTRSEDFPLGQSLPPRAIDNALVRIDDGSVNVISTPTFNGGPFRGFQEFQTAAPGFTGSGVSPATLELTRLSKGLHYMELVAFLRRDLGQRPIFERFPKIIEVD